MWTTQLQSPVFHPWIAHWPFERRYALFTHLVSKGRFFRGLGDRFAYVVVFALCVGAVVGIALALQSLIVVVLQALGQPPLSRWERTGQSIIAIVATVVCCLVCVGAHMMLWWHWRVNLILNRAQRDGLCPWCGYHPNVPAHELCPECGRALPDLPDPQPQPGPTQHTDPLAEMPAQRSTPLGP